MDEAEGLEDGVLLLAGAGFFAAGVVFEGVLEADFAGVLPLLPTEGFEAAGFFAEDGALLSPLLVLSCMLIFCIPSVQHWG